MTFPEAFRTHVVPRMRAMIRVQAVKVHNGDHDFGDAADAVMFVLHDLPCIHQADVNLPERSAWVSHSTMISAEDIATALADAGHAAEVRAQT